MRNIKKKIIPFIAIGCLSIGCSSTSLSKDMHSMYGEGNITNNKIILEYKKKLEEQSRWDIREYPLKISKQEKKDGMVRKSAYGYRVFNKPIEFDKELVEHKKDIEKKKKELASYYKRHKEAMKSNDGKKRDEQFSTIMSYKKEALRDDIDELKVKKLYFANPTLVRVHKPEEERRVVSYDTRILMGNEVFPKEFIHNSRLQHVKEKLGEEKENYTVSTVDELAWDVAEKHFENYRDIMDEIEYRESIPLYARAREDYEMIRDLGVYALYYAGLSSLDENKAKKIDREKILKSYYGACNELIDRYRDIGEYDKAVKRCYDVLGNKKSLALERGRIYEELMKVLLDNKEIEERKRLKQTLIRYYARNDTQWKRDNFEKRVEKYYEAVVEKDIEQVKIQEIKPFKESKERYFSVQFVVNKKDIYAGLMIYDGVIMENEYVHHVSNDSVYMH